MDPEQTAPILIWVHTVCHRGFLNISADEKSRRLLLCLILLYWFELLNLICIHCVDENSVDPDQLADLDLHFFSQEHRILTSYVASKAFELSPLKEFKGGNLVRSVTFIPFEIF